MSWGCSRLTRSKLWFFIRTIGTSLVYYYIMASGDKYNATSWCQSEQLFQRYLPSPSGFIVLKVGTHQTTYMYIGTYSAAKSDGDLQGFSPHRPQLGNPLLQVQYEVYCLACLCAAALDYIHM